MVNELTKEVLKNVIALMPDAIVVTDIEGKINLVNQHVQSLFGYHENELLNQTVELLIPEKARSHHVIQRKAFAKNGFQRQMGSGSSLLALINNVLDISKIVSGQMEMEFLPLSPLHLLAEIKSMLKLKVEEKKLDLMIEPVGTIPKMIYADPTRLRQIIINLCGNAIKFTREGEINVQVELLKENCLAFSVIDTGIGMTEDQQACLFQPFNQTDKSINRQYGGTGLGLYIAKELAELLGGNISVESKPGMGSTFKFWIDISKRD